MPSPLSVTVVASLLIQLVGCTSNSVRSPVGANGGEGDGGANVGVAGADSGPQMSLCDGTSELKLRLFVAPQAYREVRGAAVSVENGFPSFAVDGTCQFFMGGGWTSETTGPRAADLEWRTGRLSAELQAALQRFVDDGLNTLTDCSAPVGVFDAAARVVTDGKTTATCETRGPRFDAAWSELQSHAAEAWDSGERVALGIRVVVVESNAIAARAYEWPLVDALTAFMIEPDQETMVGLSHLVSGDADVMALRNLRAEYVESEAIKPSTNSDGQVVSDGVSPNQYLYTRDELPYEDARGLLPFWPQATTQQ